MSDKQTLAASRVNMTGSIEDVAKHDKSETDANCKATADNDEPSPASVVVGGGGGEDVAMLKGRDAGSGCGDGDGDEIELSASLTPNTYSVIYVANPRSWAFWYGILFFVLQTMLPILAFSDSLTLEFSNILDILDAPPDVNPAVRVTGTLTLFLSVIFFRDLLDAVERIHEGYHPIVLEQTPHATFCKWGLAYSLQLLNGLVFLFLIFILNVQSTTVIGMLLNFAALGFITEIDDMAFELALRGYFSESIKRVCIHVREHRTPNTKSPWLRRIALIFFTLLVMVLYLQIYFRQKNGEYVCTRIEAQFGDAFWPELQLSSGPYNVDFDYRENDRLVYTDEATGHTAIFRYCWSEYSWVFGIFDDREVDSIDDLYDEICDRGNWLSKAPKSKGTFDILEFDPLDWVTTKGKESSNSLAYPVDFFRLSCLECDIETCNNDGGICTEKQIRGHMYGVCDCNDGYFGDRCEYTAKDVCSVVAYDPRFEPFDSFKSDEFVNATFPESLELVKNAEDGTFFQWHGKAVYSSTVLDRDDIYLLAYYGRRYYLLKGNLSTLLSSPLLDTATSATTLEDVTAKYITFLETLKGGFNYEENGIYPIFVSEPIDAGTSNDRPTPTDISWFYTSSNLVAGPQISTRLMCLQD